MDFATYLNEMNQWGFCGTPESNKVFVGSGQITKQQYNQIFGVDFDTNQPINQNNNQQSTQQSSSNEQKQSTQQSGQGQPFTNNQAK